VAALLAVLAMGTYTPVYPACCAAAGQSMFTRTGTFTLYAGFALAWLAADGYDQAPGLARRWALGLAGTALLCGLAGALLPRAAWHAAAGWVVGQAVTKQVDDLGALAAGWQSVLSTQLLLAGGVLALAAGLAAVDRRWLPGLLAIELVLAGAGSSGDQRAVFAANAAAARCRRTVCCGWPRPRWKRPRSAVSGSHSTRRRRSSRPPVRRWSGTCWWAPARGNARATTPPPAASLAWLERLAALPPERTGGDPGGAGLSRHLVRRCAWTAFDRPAGEGPGDGAAAARSADLTPQRLSALAGPGGLGLAGRATGSPAGAGPARRGWCRTTPRSRSGSAPAGRSRCGPGTRRLSWRLGQFLSLLATAAWAAAVTRCSRRASDPISAARSTMV